MVWGGMSKVEACPPSTALFETHQAVIVDSELEASSTTWHCMATIKRAQTPALAVCGGGSS